MKDFYKEICKIESELMIIDLQSSSDKYPIDQNFISDYIANNKNYGKYSSFKISKGDKVAQCTLISHEGYLMGYETEIARVGGFGSTDKKVL